MKRENCGGYVFNLSAHVIVCSCRDSVFSLGSSCLYAIETFFETASTEC